MQEAIIICVTAFITHIMYRAYKQYKGGKPWQQRKHKYAQVLNNGKET
ncbi:hypothetical protein HMPREF3232_01091 [Fannyhessea vaginae]|nr:hypothetical protein HMPREF3232_01091 [Fannyhessea vaginae]